MRGILLLTILTIVFSSSAMTQIIAERKYDLNHHVRDALNTAIREKYGSNYKVSSFHIMDSLIANSRRQQITDPYSTLAGCILFSARPSPNNEDSILTGMYKNGQIIWDDYPGTGAGFGGALLTTKDINNDGEVDILQAELDHQRFTPSSSIFYLWILSWNGTRGKIINDIDSVTHQSTLVSTDKMYDLVDVNPDSVKQIRGWINSAWQDDFPHLNPKTLPSIIYSWNGSKYGFFPDSPSNKRK